MQAYRRILTPYTKEGVESLRILPYTIGGQAIKKRETFSFTMSHPASHVYATCVSSFEPSNAREQKLGYV